MFSWALMLLILFQGVRMTDACASCTSARHSQRNLCVSRALQPAASIICLGLRKQSLTCALQTATGSFRETPVLCSG